MHVHELPQNATDIIFEHVEASVGRLGIARLRLVSKAWLAAVQQYPGSAKLSTLDKLSPLQHIMPNVSKLSISHKVEGPTVIDLTLLAKFCQLSSLELSAVNPSHKFNWKVIEVMGIPNTLKRVKVSDLKLHSGSFNNAAALITSLDYQRGNLTQPDDWKWMQNLPQLKVNILFFLFKVEKCSASHLTACSLHHLSGAMLPCHKY